MKKTTWNLLFLFLTSTVSISQHIQSVSDIKSPNASTLGLYGDIPVSQFTGSANVNVPIYTIEENKIPLDISLSYNSTGIRVASVASWVGQNWSLNAGGVITRTLRGSNRDEEFESTDFNGKTYVIKGFYFAKHKLNTTNWASTQNLNDLVEESYDMDHSNQYLGMDLEPDIFTFNFMGHFGKFFLGNDGEWKIESNSNLRIEIDPSHFINNPNAGDLNISDQYYSLKYNKCISNIKIIDDKGNKFIFGKTTNEIEYYTGSFYSHNAIYANAWFLSEVHDSQDNVIYSFNYERGDPVANFNRTNSYRKGLCVSDNTGILYSTVNRTKNGLVSGNLVFPIYLKNIKTLKGNTIFFESSITSKKPYLATDDVITTSFQQFVPSNTVTSNLRYLTKNGYPSDGTFLQRQIFVMNQLKWRQLNQIIVRDKFNTYINGFTLNFNSGVSRRLNLNSISKNYASGNFTEDYFSFEYNDFNGLPDYLSKQIDKWGFYNGNDYIVRYIGFNQFPFEEYPPEDYFSEHYNSRASNATFLQKGLLNKMIYPTKGFVKFKYEPHSAELSVNNEKQLESHNNNAIIGGVRIQEIIRNDGAEDIQKVTYEYSGGILYVNPFFFYPDWEIRHDENSIKAVYSFSINSMVPLDNISGTHIGYSQVIERHENNGYKLYNFSNYDNFPDIPYEGTLNYSSSVFNRCTDRSLLRGKIKEIKTFDNDNNVIKKNIFTYRNLNSGFNDNFIKAFQYVGSRCDGIVPNFGNAVKIFYMDYDVVEEIQTEYLAEGAITTRLEYNKSDFSIHTEDNIFNGDRKLTSLKKISSNNDELVTSYKYPENFLSKQLREDPFGNWYIYIYPSIYKKMLDKNMHGYPIETVNRFNEATIKADITEYTEYEGMYLPKKSYTLETDNFPYIYDNAIAFQSSSSSVLDKDINMVGSFIIDEYDKYGNIQQIHMKDSPINTTYIWGYEGMHPIVKIEGVSYTQADSWFYQDHGLHLSRISLYSDADHDEITEQNFLYYLNLLRATILNYSDSVKITVYTYNPLVGITNIIDSRGDMMTYIYDEYNRLKFIKDKDGNVLNEYKYHFKN